MRFILLSLVLSTIIFANSKPENLGFRYGFLSKKNYDSKINNVLTDSSVIYSGDFLKINIGYLTNTNIQIIYQSFEGKYILLSSKDASSKNIADIKQDTTYFTALEWTEMKPPSGIESFYFINSIKPLTKLKNLFEKYKRAPERGQKKLAVKIQDVINYYNPNIHSDLNHLSSRLEKPVTGGVAFRGENDKISDLSVTHECKGNKGIAFKKITLLHR